MRSSADVVNSIVNINTHLEDGNQINMENDCIMMKSIALTAQTRLWILFKYDFFFHQIFHAQLTPKYYAWKFNSWKRWLLSRRASELEWQLWKKLNCWSHWKKFQFSCDLLCWNRFASVFMRLYTVFICHHINQH